jgi:energy-converting hydrogenase B subunit M
MMLKKLARKKSIHVMLTFNPREVDVLLVTGPVTKRTTSQLVAIYEKIPEPKAVIGVGACPNMGCTYMNVYGELGPSEEIDGPLENIIPVDAKVPGCAVRPQDVVSKVIEVLPKILEGK